MKITKKSEYSLREWLTDHLIQDDHLIQVKETHKLFEENEDGPRAKIYPMTKLPQSISTSFCAKRKEVTDHFNANMHPTKMRHSNRPFSQYTPSLYAMG